MYKYLEITRDKDNEVVNRIDVTGKTERSCEVIESGMNQNLNHNEYTVDEIESETEKDIV